MTWKKEIKNTILITFNRYLLRAVYHVNILNWLSNFQKESILQDKYYVLLDFQMIIKYRISKKMYIVVYKQ